MFIIVTSTLIIIQYFCKTTTGGTSFKKTEGKQGLLAAHGPYQVQTAQEDS